MAAAEDKSPEKVPEAEAKGTEKTLGGGNTARRAAKSQAEASEESAAGSGGQGSSGAGHVIGDSKLTGWRRFMHVYYFANATVVASYLMVRSFFPNSRVHQLGDFMELTREQEFSIMCGVALVARYRKCATWDEFVSSILLWTKTLVVVLCWFTDKRVMSVYLIVYFLLFTIIQAPKYRGKRMVSALNPQRIEQKIVRGDHRVTWLVFFKATWSKRCDFYEPIFGELSLKYTTKLLKFATVEVTQWPDAAKKFNIDTRHSSYELPCLIMFENGKQTRRLPPVNSKGEITPVALDAAGTVKFFDLDRRAVFGA